LENGFDGFFWTSGSDQGSEGSFYWTATGQNMKYTFWHSGQPDNMGGNENCGIVDQLEILDGTTEFVHGMEDLFVNLIQHVFSS
jgi:hypothetical protein